MAVRAKAMLEVAQLEVVADRGYYDGAEVKSCAGAGVTTYIPKPGYEPVLGSVMLKVAPWP
jgi:transposase